MRPALFAFTLLVSVAFVTSGCEQLNNDDGDATPVDTQAAADVFDATPPGPVELTLDPATIGLERANNSQGTPESNGDLCLVGQRDPRDGLRLRPGKPCIDNLVLRFTIPGSGGAARVGWSPNFTGATSSAGQVDGGARAITGVPTDGSAVSITLDTIANQIPGGVRVRLSFDAMMSPRSAGSSLYDLTIEEVTITLL